MTHPTDTHIQQDAGDFAPHKPEVESAVLAAYLSDPTEAIEYATGLHDEHFHLAHHKAIWDVINTMVSNGETPDLVTVGDRVSTSYPALSGMIYPYLAELSANAKPPAAIASYLPLLQTARIARRTLDAGRLTQGLATDIIQQPGERTNQLLTKAQDVIFSVIEEAGVHQAMMPISETIPPTLDALDEDSETAAEVFETGLVDLDRQLNGGMRPGELVVVAARPGVGKSTLAVDILRKNAIEQGHTCVMFSLEMSQKDCITRILSAEAKVPFSHLRSGSTPTEKDWNAIGKAINRISPAPLYIDATPDISISYLYSQARYMARRHDLKIVVVDYLQLMTGDSRVERHQLIAEVSRKLKVMAKELGVLVIAVAQLNRGPEQRQDKRPQSSDLRESGQIEQDADTILLLYREDSFDPASERVGEADIIVSKHRNGPTGSVTAAFQGEYCRFAALAPEPPY